MQSDIESSALKQGSDKSTAATLCWRSLNVAAKTPDGSTKQILQDVSGYVEPGHMLALMGPSGSGKTTMLDTLAGRLHASVSLQGQVLLNGHRSNLAYGVSSYVTQDEELIGTLTVREVLMYTAMLRLPSSMSQADKAARVEEVMVELGLNDAADAAIGNWHKKGISGGQKRRVAIGCELIVHPTLMFLDEPTSGLDAAAAFYVMSVIKKLAAGGRTIISVIHQPSSEVFELFDQLCMLSGGRCVFFGPADQALAHYEAAGVPCPPLRNPADHFLHAINPDFIAAGKESISGNISALASAYSSSQRPQVEARVEALSAPGPVYRGSQAGGTGWFSQSVVLTRRTSVNFWRNLGVFWLRLAMYTMLCLCIGTIYYKLDYSWKGANSRAALLFFVVAFLTFMSIAGFPAFQEDMQVFLRERLNGYYGVSNFVVANTLASAPFIMGISVISSAVVYWLAGLNDKGDRFPYFFINLYMALTTVEGLMMAIAAIVPHYLMGIAGGAGLMGMFMLVCGFFQPVGQLPNPVWRYPLHYMAFHSYAFAGFMHNEFDGTEGWQCPCALQPGGCPVANCSLTGPEVIDTWTLNSINKWVDVAIQLGMALAYRGLFLAMLKLKERMARR